jgi:hypothetical protein
MSTEVLSRHIVGLRLTPLLDKTHPSKSGSSKLSLLMRFTKKYIVGIFHPPVYNASTVHFIFFI